MIYNQAYFFPLYFYFWKLVIYDFNLPVNNIYKLDSCAVRTTSFILFTSLSLSVFVAPERVDEGADLILATI